MCTDDKNDVDNDERQSLLFVRVESSFETLFFFFFFSFTDIHGYPLRVDGRKQHDRVLRSSSKDHQLMRVSRIFFCGEEAMNVILFFYLDIRKSMYNARWRGVFAWEKKYNDLRG